MLLDGVRVTVNNAPDMTEGEISRYIAFLRKRLAAHLVSLAISLSEGKVRLDYKVRGAKFERIRRITGYLVGTTDRWNNAKRAEERERVKHE